MDYQYYPLVIRRRATLIISILLFIGLLTGLNAGWMYTNPETEQLVSQETVQQVETELSSQSTVTGRTSMYDTGVTVENRSTYLLYAMPNTTVTSETAVIEQTDMEQTMSIGLYAKSNNEEFWAETTHLDSNTTANSENIQTSAEFNIRTLAERRSQVTAELGGSGSVSPFLLVETEYEYKGQTREKVMRVPIYITSNTYGFGTPESGQVAEHTVRQTEQRSQLSPSIFVQGGISGFTILLAFVLGLYRYFKGLPSDWHVEIARHQDWVSQGKMMHINPDNEFELDDVSSVVDMAIDLQKRALYDPRVEAVLVMDDTMTAYYVSAPDSSWTPNMPYSV